MSREIKFRCWDTENKMFFVNYSYPIGSDYRIMLDIETGIFDVCGVNGGDYDTEPSIRFQNKKIIAQQFTGLLDKNGKEIYEFMELDNKWEVNWRNGKYILRDISTGDIIDLNYENKYEITREYTKIPKDSEGGSY